jgi:hypothetical protein
MCSGREVQLLFCEGRGRVDGLGKRSEAMLCLILTVDVVGVFSCSPYDAGIAGLNGGCDFCSVEVGAVLLLQGVRLPLIAGFSVWCL